MFSQVAGRSLGELVRKLGERVLPSIIPILAKGLEDEVPSTRQVLFSFFPGTSDEIYIALWFPLLIHHLVQGVCMGLSEVMGSAGKHQLVAYMGDLIPTIRRALCDRYVIPFFFSQGVLKVGFAE
jgi:hypothetical protein